MKTRWLLIALVAGAVTAGCLGGSGHGGAPAPSSAAAPIDPAATTAAASKIDALMDRAWADGGVTPSPDVDEATYLRRASIDLIGRIPSSEEVRVYLADTSPSKRRDLVDRLLASAEHDRHLAQTWDGILMGSEAKNRQVDRPAFGRWLERRFRENAKWDELVRELVTAEGTSSLGGPVGVQAWVGGPERAEEERQAGVNGATNFLLRHARSPQDLAGTTSRVFLGVQIQCAQCHDHKTEAWKQSDFRSFASVFTQTRAEQTEREKGAIPVYEISDMGRTPRKYMRNQDVAAIAKAPPRALDGTDLSGDDAGRREALADWMTSPQNPWFARAFVNRVWAELLGSGLVHPVDDLRPKNPAILPEVLDALAEEFTLSGYDVDGLYRTICATKAYSRSVEARPRGPREDLFAHASLRPMSSDALLGSIFVAADVPAILEEKAPKRAEEIKLLLRRRMHFVFEEDAESNGEAFAGTVQQSLFLMNGMLPTGATAVAAPTVLGRMLKESASDDVIITELYARTLGRRPSAAELARAKEFLVTPPDADPREDSPVAEPADPKRKDKGKAKGKKDKLGADLPAAAVRSQARTDRERAYEDLFWALLNSSEFSFRR